MSYLQHVMSKIRHDPLPRVILDSLAKTGLKIQPYYLFVEGLFEGTLPHLETGIEQFRLTYLGQDDMKVIASIPYRVFSEDTL